MNQSHTPKYTNIISYSKSTQSSSIGIVVLVYWSSHTRYACSSSLSSLLVSASTCARLSASCWRKTASSSFRPLYIMFSGDNTTTRTQQLKGNAGAKLRLKIELNNRAQCKNASKFPFLVTVSTFSPYILSQSLQRVTTTNNKTYSNHIKATVFANTVS